MAGGNYGRVRVTFWTDPDIKRKLTAEQKTLLLYYFSSPHGNMIGLYYCPPMFAADETGISVDRVREWTNGPLAPFVSYDEDTEEVFVRKLAEHQVGTELKDGDKRIPAVVKALREVHSKSLLREFLTTYVGWPLGITPPEAPPKGHRRGIRVHVPDAGSPSEAFSSSSSSSSSSPPAIVHSEAKASAGGPLSDSVQVVLGSIQQEQPIAEEMSTGQIIGAWVQAQPTRPSQTDIRKQGAAAKRLSESRTAEQIMAAMIGMGQLFPHSKGEPWDLFDLEKKFAKAQQAAGNHPDLKRRRDWEAFNRELGEAA